MKTIGIVGRRELLRNENYYSAVEACGAGTALLDLSTGTSGVCELDGIVLPGGVDVNPALYNENNKASRDINNRLDWYELAVLSEAVKYKIPVLGICRGHQLINVFFGGSLIQNVENCGIHDYYEDFRDRAHSSRIKNPSFLFKIYGTDRIDVNSAHHQAVGRLGKGIREAQYSEDGLVEAIYHTKLPVFGVQWHPERMCLKNARPDTVDGLKVFQYFVQDIVADGLWEEEQEEIIEYYI